MLTAVDEITKKIQLKSTMHLFCNITFYVDKSHTCIQQLSAGDF